MIMFCGNVKMIIVLLTYMDTERRIIKKKKERIIVALGQEVNGIAVHPR